MALEANALCAVADITARGVTKSQALIEDEINSVSQQFENYCGRVFRQLARVASPSGSSQAPRERLPGSGEQWLQLSSYPLISIQEIQVDGQVVTDYELVEGYAQRGLLYREDGWPLVCFPWDMLTRDPDPTRPQLSILAAYTGGYATIPADLKKAAIDEVLAALSITGDRRHIVEEQTPAGRRLKLSSAGLSGTWSAQTIQTLDHYAFPRR